MGFSKKSNAQFSYHIWEVLVRSNNGQNDFVDVLSSDNKEQRLVSFSLVLWSAHSKPLPIWQWRLCRTPGLSILSHRSSTDDTTSVAEGTFHSPTPAASHACSCRGENRSLAMEGNSLGHLQELTEANYKSQARAGATIPLRSIDHHLQGPS